MLKNLANKIYVAILIALAMAFAGSAFADTAPAAAVTAPDWVGPVVAYVQTIPKVGPVITQLLELVAILGTLFTMLTVFLTGFCKTLSVISRFAKLAGIAEKVQAFHDKVWPYLAYLSIFNVQKKPKA